MINLENKKSALVFTVPYNHAFALASVLFDLKKYSPNLTDDIIVYHDGIRPQDQTRLNSILPVKFLRYQFPSNDISKFENVVTKHFTLMIFARFEALRLLDEYRCVVYSDYDILIKEHISDILDVPDSGWSIIPSTFKLREALYHPISNYEMGVPVLQASLFVLWDHLSEYKLMYEWCYSASIKYAECLYLPDIAIFTLLWQEFKVKPSKSLDTHVYSCHPNDIEYLEKSKIIHAYGLMKFWNGWHFEQWEENYSEWIKMDGTPYFGRTRLGRLISPFGKFIKNFKLSIKNNRLFMSFFKLIKKN